MIEFISPPTVALVEEVAANLRESDRREVSTLRNNEDVVEVLKECFKTEGQSYVVTRDGKAACLFGHEPSQDILHIGAKAGCIWLIGTDLIGRNRMKFLRLSRKVCEEVLTKYDYLWNIVDSRNDLHVRWLKWLGFLFVDEVSVGPDRVPFYLVIKHKRCA